MSGGASRPHCRGGLLMTLGGVAAVSDRVWAFAPNAATVPAPP